MSFITGSRSFVGGREGRRNDPFKSVVGDRTPCRAAISYCSSCSMRPRRRPDEKLFIGSRWHHSFSRLSCSRVNTSLKERTKEMKNLVRTAAARTDCGSTCRHGWYHIFRRRGFQARRSRPFGLGSPLRGYLGGKSEVAI